MVLPSVCPKPVVVLPRVTSLNLKFVALIFPGASAVPFSLPCRPTLLPVIPSRPGGGPLVSIRAAVLRKHEFTSAEANFCLKNVHITKEGDYFNRGWWYITVSQPSVGCDALP